MRRKARAPRTASRQVRRPAKVFKTLQQRLVQTANRTGTGLREAPRALRIGLPPLQPLRRPRPQTKSIRSPTDRARTPVRGNQPPRGRVVRALGRSREVPGRNLPQLPYGRNRLLAPLLDPPPGAIQVDPPVLRPLHPSPISRNLVSRERPSSRRRSKNRPSRHRVS